MADKESAQLKHYKAAQEKAKAYKTSHDVERVHHLIGAAHLMRDYPAASALQNSLVRELVALSLKQAELDAKEKEEDEKALAEAKAADAKPVEEEEHANPRARAR